METWYINNPAALAVSNLIKTPAAPKAPSTIRTLNCFMSDEPGALTRTTGIMAARGYNIESVVVSRTELPSLSRMTITVKGKPVVVQQMKKQLEDLSEVWAVVDLTEAKTVEREILLIKLSTMGPDHIACGGNSCTPRERTTPSTRQEHSEDQEAELPQHQILERCKRLEYICSLSSMFGAKIVDVGAECCIVELCAKSERVNAFMKLVAPFGILEAARSGRMAMSRTAKLSLFEHDPPETQSTEEGEAAAQAQAAADMSNLPPS
ncbi:acetolactate synthase, regulatory subunit [Linderina macrospora]|uniref:Acetolactate synthase, regulatory subunit n=1 Tax=Linderina macrospora TaxID=4868 RepID=A0ACC1J8T3_9FUNG|nr:acetolactate synthase, regulatory subunit [Linderina macrospora]